MAGASGRTGSKIMQGLLSDPSLELVGALGRSTAGKDIGEIIGGSPRGIRVEQDLDALLTRTRPAVLVDFTLPGAAAENVPVAIRQGVAAVVGTTGISETAQGEWDRLARKEGVGVLLAPNFALGAVLMMQFAREAARFYSRVEIVEAHHPGKLDAPSGTARRTAVLIKEGSEAASTSSETGIEAGAGISPGAKGVSRKPEGVRSPGVDGDAASRAGAMGQTADVAGGIPIHSIRLPGIVAQHQVIFGADGETLALVHQSIDRSSFVPGVLLAVHRVGELRGLVIGLENIILSPM